MSEPKWLSPVERDAWLALVSVTTLLPAALDSELQAQAKITLFDYNVLAMLSEAPEHILAMSELASRTSASLSRLSHVVKKLEGRGWVERNRSPEDARVTIARLTADGWETVQALAPEHVASVRKLIFQGLDDTRCLRTGAHRTEARGPSGSRALDLSLAACGAVGPVAGTGGPNVRQIALNVPKRGCCRFGCRCVNRLEW